MDESWYSVRSDISHVGQMKSTSGSQQKAIIRSRSLSCRYPESGDVPYQDSIGSDCDRSVMCLNGLRRCHHEAVKGRRGKGDQDSSKYELGSSRSIHHEVNQTYDTLRE